MSYYIPQEILDNIIRCATDDDERNFSNCASLVSHTFHQIALPYKFRSLTFQLHDKENLYSTVIPLPKFCDAINDGDARALSLAPLVQELSLLEWRGKEGFDDIFIEKPFEKMINAVFSFRNLTILHMHRCATSPATMKQLAKLVQLQSLHTYRCQDMQYVNEWNMDSYSAFSNLQSLHTLVCQEDWPCFESHLACISMKNLRILKSSDEKVIEALLTTNPSVQLKELWLTGNYCGDYSLLWNYLTRVSSLTHLSMPYLRLTDDLPSLNFPLQELEYLHINIAFAPCFAHLHLKEMDIDSNSKLGPLMAEVRQFWRGIVFPHVPGHGSTIY